MAVLACIWCDLLCAEEATRAKLYRAAAKILSLCPRPASIVEPDRMGEVAKADPTILVLMPGHEIVWAQHRRKWVCLLC